MPRAPDLQYYSQAEIDEVARRRTLVRGTCIRGPIVNPNRITMLLYLVM